MTREHLIGRQVIVSTNFGAILYGVVKDYIENPGVGASVTFTHCRQVLYWDDTVRGFPGLAANGPSDACTFGAVAFDATFITVNSILPCTPAACKVWNGIKQ